MDTIPIEVLRVAFAQSVIATMATQLGCYLRLVSHPDLQYFDLLDALSRNAIIGDDAATRLHRRLQRASADTVPVANRLYWERVFADRGIDPAARYHDNVAEESAPAA